ncbi:MAG: hypothetical protein LWY06_11975 [Firmicutes bacterium]|nr:hypothetical protein [Bacillota bacterium]
MVKIKISTDIIKKDHLPENCMICVDRTDTKAYPWPLINIYPISFILLTITSVIIAAKLDQYLIYAMVLSLVVGNFIFSGKQVINMRFCDDCNKEFEYQKKLLKYINLAVMFVCGIFAGFFLKETQWITAVILMLLITMIFPRIYCLITKNSPLYSSIKKDYSVLLFPDKRYKDVYDDFQTNAVFNPNKNNPEPIICSSCSIENIPGSQFCEKCGTSLITADNA